MIKVKDVIAYLDNFRDLNARWDGRKSYLEDEIVGISSDQNAKFGDLAWISKKQTEVRFDTIRRFKGSLLIGPKDVLVEGIPYISCDKPKLGFIKVVNHFFPGIAEIYWPSQEQQVYKESVIHASVRLCPGVIIGSNVSIGQNVIIGPNTVIANTIIQSNVVIGANCSIGLSGFGYEKDTTGSYLRFPHIGGVEIGDCVEIGSNTCIDRGSIGNTIISAGVKIDNHVHIAHNVRIGTNSLIIANSMIGGSTVIGSNVWVAPSVSIMNQVSIGDSALLGMGAVVLKTVQPSTIMVGNPARLITKETSNE